MPVLGFNPRTAFFILDCSIKLGRVKMNICSFLPSATEIIYALGLEDQLYGVTHECDFPPQAKDKPWVVKSVFDGTEPTSGEISKVISERLEQGLGIYEIDENILVAANPDLLLTQAICEV